MSDERNDERKAGQTGRTKAVTEADLTVLKDAVGNLGLGFDTGASGIWTRREESHAVRYCQWEGQDSSGRKLKENFNGEEQFPFEGASDVRLRLADMIVDENVGIQLAAAASAIERIAPMEAGDVAFAKRIKMLVKWALITKGGVRFWRELEKCLQYKEGDSPGLGIMGVYWKQEESLDYELVSLEDVARMLAEQAGSEFTDEVYSRIWKLFADEDQHESAFAAIGGLVPPTVSDGTIKRMVRELGRNGESEIPVPYLKVNEPVWQAHRVMEDVFFASGVNDLQAAPRIFRRVVMDVGDVDARARAEGWTKGFAKELKEQAGSTAFDKILRGGADEFSDVTTSGGDGDPRRNECEVIWAYERLTDADGVSGIFLTVFSAFVDKAAKKRELLDYLHGDYPFVEFPREILNDRLLDSRGVPEIVMTDQWQLKRTDDSFGDHTTISTIPPVSVPRNRPRMQLVIGPLKQVKEDRPGQIRFWDVPKYPTAADKYRDAIYRRVNEYFGRPGDGVDPDLVILKRQRLVNSFLGSMCQAVRMTVQLCMQYLPDDEIQRIVSRPEDREPFEIPRSRREIQGLYDLMLSFNVKTLNNEYVLGVIKAIGELVLPMDTRSTVERDKLVGLALSMLDPYIADLVTRPVEEADRQEVDDELLNFVQISAGIEPEMAEDGQNWRLRLQVLQGIGERNPEAFRELGEVNGEILQKRMQHLGFMVQQEENAQIGRVGAEGALG